MNIIKLNATTSTNDYLKELLKQKSVDNYTVVSAEYQTNGRGQMGKVWTSEKGMNLMFSMLVKFSNLTTEHLFLLNVIYANSVHKVLKSYSLDKLYIKWANDIVAKNKKIAGMLTENIIKPNGDVESIIGIGINLNQINFDNIPNAGSLYSVYGLNIDKNELMIKIAYEIQQMVEKKHLVEENEWQYYHQYLYKKDIPTAFELPDGLRFMGMIRSVTPQGFLIIEDEQGAKKKYSIKEVKMLY